MKSRSEKPPAVNSQLLGQILRFVLQEKSYFYINLRNQWMSLAYSQMAVQLWERSVDPCGPRSAEENSKLDKFNAGLFYETANKEKTEMNVGITRLNSLPALFSRWYGDASI